MLKSHNGKPHRLSVLLQEEDGRSKNAIECISSLIICFIIA